MSRYLAGAIAVVSLLLLTLLTSQASAQIRMTSLDENLQQVTWRNFNAPGTLGSAATVVLRRRRSES